MAQVILATMAELEVPQERVLVVEDEKALASVVGSYLRRAGYDVTLEYTGPDAVSTARSLDPDVIVLDLGLPGLDGIEVCRQVRTFSDCYILMLTARGDEVDKLIGLSVGADDYLTKPFSARELVARVQAMLRRPRSAPAAAAPPRWVFGALTIDPAVREVTLDGAPVPLTPTEFDLLAALAEEPRRVLSRSSLLSRVWGTQWAADDRLVDVHLGRVRRKLGDDPAQPRFILTVRGAGYRMGTGR